MPTKDQKQQHSNQLNAPQRTIKDHNDRKGGIGIQQQPLKQIPLQKFVKMEKINEQLIFFEQKHSTTLDDQIREPQCVASIPYLKKGDSSIYVDQFLAKAEEPLPALTPKVEVVKEESSPSNKADESYQVSEIAHFNPSAFHNFQKHLTVCLKHALYIVQEDKTTNDYRAAAAKLWKTFKNSSVSTKRVLHFLLGEKNEHPITDAALKEYGLLKIYDAYDPETMRQARIYLQHQAMRQISEGKLEEYIISKKLKDKEKFKRYVKIFVKELQNGYLRKRLPKEDVAYLLSQ